MTSMTSTNWNQILAAQLAVRRDRFCRALADVRRRISADTVREFALAAGRMRSCLDFIKAYTERLDVRVGRHDLRRGRAELRDVVRLRKAWAGLILDPTLGQDGRGARVKNLVKRISRHGRSRVMDRLESLRVGRLDRRFTRIQDRLRAVADGSNPGRAELGWIRRRLSQAYRRLLTGRATIDPGSHRSLRRVARDFRQFMESAGPAGEFIGESSHPTLRNWEQIEMGLEIQTDAALEWLDQHSRKWSAFGENFASELATLRQELLGQRARQIRTIVDRLARLSADWNGVPKELSRDRIRRQVRVRVSRAASRPPQASLASLTLPAPRSKSGIIPGRAGSRRGARPQTRLTR